MSSGFGVTRGWLGVLVTALIALVMPLEGQPAGAEIKGQVLNSVARPVSGARVTGLVTGAAGVGLRAESVSGQDGRFTLAGLSPGAWLVCADTPGGELLNPCLWDRRFNVVTVAAGQQVSGVKVHLQKGIPLLVRIDDPAQVLAAPETPGGPFLKVGVWTTWSLFFNARKGSVDAQGRNYTLTIPAGKLLKLTIVGHRFLVRDENGQPVNASDLITFKTDPGDAQKSFRFQVSAIPNP